MSQTISFFSRENNIVLFSMTKVMRKMVNKKGFSLIALRKIPIDDIPIFFDQQIPYIFLPEMMLRNVLMRI